MKKYTKILIVPQNANKDEVDKLVKQLEEEGFEVVISEVNDNCAEDEQTTLIETEVENCEIIFVLIGPVTDEDICVKKGIEEGDRQDRKIVGIYMGGGSESIPQALENVGGGLILNNTIKIIAILNGEPAPWEDTTGAPRKAKNKIDKEDC